MPVTLGPDLSFIDAHLIGGCLFGLVILCVGVFTLITIYHWMRYGRGTMIALPAIAVYLFVSLCLIALTGSALV